MPHVHNALHHLTRVQGAYRAALGEGDPAFNGLERAGETITPTLDLWALPEWALLRGEVLYQRSVAVGALAGNYSTQELVNPVGSGILAVVLEIMNQATLSQTSVDSGAALGVLSTTRGVAADARLAQLGPVSACTIVGGQVAGGVTNPQDVIIAATRSARPYIIPPGKKLFVFPTAVNTASWLSWFWTERKASPEELASFGS